ncbi:MAG: MFS transporter [Stigonema ocellatum SAG 48.90 = DSM 106950]|nr:MFS transporter [Stigonema ocellatum SAG 48.90 = DSM 106950]
MRTFTLIWLGQLVSLIGSAITEFSLNIWVLQQTGSVAQFTFLTVISTVPIIVISPLAGTLVDRWSRRWIMIISQLCIGLCTLIFVALLTIGQLALWHIYLINILISIFVGFSLPAYKASIVSLVPQEDLARVSGMVQLASGIQQMVSPLLAGVLLNIVHLRGIFLINLASVLLAIVPLLFVQFAEVSQPTADSTQSFSFLQETAKGWTYLKESPGMVGFVLLFSIYQFCTGFVFILAYPLVLSLSTPDNVGKLIFVGGIGTVLGAIVMSNLGNNLKNLIGLVISAMSLSGLCIAVAGLRPSILQIAIASLLFFLSIPFINGSMQVMFQKKVPDRLQGRVFALIGAISQATTPIAAIIAGALADHVFEPLMAFDGPWSKNLVGHIMGSGPGRGVGLLYVIMGFSILMVALIAYQYPPIRKLEENLPEYEFS